MNPPQVESQRDLGACSGNEQPDFANIARLIRSGDPQGQAVLSATFGKGVRFFLRRLLRTQDVDCLAIQVLAVVSEDLRRGCIPESELVPHMLMIVRKFAADVNIACETMNQVNASSESEIIAAAQVLRSVSAVEREVLIRLYLGHESSERICGELGLHQSRVVQIRAKARERFLARGSVSLKYWLFSVFRWHSARGQR
jgi:hypothetical protein